MSDPTINGRFTSDPTLDIDVPEVALAIGAHPDDIEFGCGGTLAKWAAAGCEVHHLVCTDGSKGSWDPTQDRSELVGQRQEEQRQASIELGGGGRVTFLGWTDGELEAGLSARAQVARQIRTVRPDVVLGHDPWRRYRLHPDHRHAGFLATDGVVAARDPHFFPEQNLAPHRPRALLLWEADEVDHLEDITGFEKVKLRALMAHRSQLRSTMGIEHHGDAAQVDAFERRMASRHAANGAALDVAAAEAFRLITDL